MCANKLLNLQYLPTTEMPANMLTNGLCSGKRYAFMKLLVITYEVHRFVCDYLDIGGVELYLYYSLPVTTTAI